MLSRKKFRVCGRPTAPGSKLPRVEPMEVLAHDGIDAIVDARALWGIDPTMVHRYTFEAVDVEAQRKRRELTAHLVGGLTGP
ncbi:MAG: hypothetical protein HQ582_13255 [Planctomycetes bacterium]|nr:hypothetical protein [Planctomycetota bacterium]